MAKKLWDVLQKRFTIIDLGAAIIASVFTIGSIWPFLDDYMGSTAIIVIGIFVTFIELFIASWIREKDGQGPDRDFVFVQWLRQKNEARAKAKMEKESDVNQS